jgi:hypothetical protein
VAEDPSVATIIFLCTAVGNEDVIVQVLNWVSDVKNVGAEKVKTEEATTLMVGESVDVFIERRKAGRKRGGWLDGSRVGDAPSIGCVRGIYW